MRLKCSSLSTTTTFTEGRFDSPRFIKIAYAKYKLRMTAKIIAHNEEIQRMERIADSNRESKSKSEMKGKSVAQYSDEDNEQPLIRTQHQSRSSYEMAFEPRYNGHFQNHEPFLTAVNLHEITNNDFEVSSPTLPDESEAQQEDAKVVQRMLDYLEI